MNIKQLKLVHNEHGRCYLMEASNVKSKYTTIEVMHLQKRSLLKAYSVFIMEAGHSGTPF